MTSQSPRIYTYKITFEEVPYYYYGVHKEKRFDEKYWGSPKTNKWCWELYTPKKQILEIFNSREDADKVERRLIKPVFNIDKWCLNENCGGLFSLDTCSRAGKKGGNKNKENGTGIFKISAEERKEISKKAGSIGGKITAEKQKQNKICFYNLEFQSEMGKRGGKKTKQLGLGIHSLTTQQRKEIGKRNSSQRWICEETGFISNAAGVVRYQKAKNIDTSKRKRIE